MQHPYELLDSGAESKLERFGDKIISRPSSLAIWRPLRAPAQWKQADATYDPDRGWTYRSSRFDSWQVKFGEATVELLLQNNGQIGIFPDHWLYAPKVIDAISERSSASQPARVLNLFAYTGLASVLAAKCGAKVTHVDLSKSAVTWCKRNVELSQAKDVRLICDDALKFAARERKRDAQYEVVISDPPSFGRISKNKSWKLEEIASQHLEDCIKLLAPGGILFFSSHHALLESQVMANMIWGLAPANSKVTPMGLFIPEGQGARKLPAGHLVVCELAK